MVLVNDGKVRSCPREGPWGGGMWGQRGKRAKGAARIRVGSWNIGTLTRKSMELAKIFSRRGRLI